MDLYVKQGTDYHKIEDREKARDALRSIAFPTATDPHGVVALLDSYAKDVQENLIVIILNAMKKVTKVVPITRGLLDGAQVHPREIFAPAIEARAHCIVVAHNHPSGDVAPSREDRDATRKLVEAGKILGIPVVDHVIVGSLGGYYSFHENNSIN